MDKRRIFLNTGKSVASIPVAPFTLVGATTDPDGIIDPLIDRFRMVLHLDYYSQEELAAIVKQRLRALHWDYGPHLVDEIVETCAGVLHALRFGCSRVPIAFRWLGAAMYSPSNAFRRACEVERISDLGADNIQQKLMSLLGNGPQRVGVLASMLGVSTKVLQKTVEPFLLRQGLIVKTDVGLRTLTDNGRRHSGVFLSAFCPKSVRMTLELWRGSVF